MLIETGMFVVYNWQCNRCSWFTKTYGAHDGNNSFRCQGERNLHSGNMWKTQEQKRWICQKTSKVLVKAHAPKGNGCITMLLRVCTRIQQKLMWVQRRSRKEGRTKRKWKALGNPPWICTPVICMLCSDSIVTGILGLERFMGTR